MRLCTPPRFETWLLLLLLASSMSLGCSRVGQPVAPGADALATGQTTCSMRAPARALWGMWHCYMEPGSAQVEAVPMRGMCFTANVNNLLEVKPGNLLIQDIDLTNYETEGRVDCTITLRHPLPGLDMYSGFDVWGVFMHNGASALNYDGLTYSGGPAAGVNEAVLLNPDGFTRWFNQPEFDGNGLPLLEFWPGNLSNLPAPSATLNPYKVFADELGFEDDYHQWITSTGNADDRGIFRAGMMNSRRYELKFPIIGGTPRVDFQYAAIATWEPGDPTLTGNPAIYDPGDFPSSANCEEPFLLNVSTIGSELYYVDSTDFGGAFLADVEVFDWQGGSVGRLGVPNEVEGVIIEGDFVPGGSYTFTQAELAAMASSGTENSSVFQVEIADCTPQSSGVADFWLIVESAGLNGESYYQGFPTEYPVGARRAAFLPGTVQVGDESPGSPCKNIPLRDVEAVDIAIDHTNGDLLVLYADKTIYKYWKDDCFQSGILFKSIVEHQAQVMYNIDFAPNQYFAVVLTYVTSATPGLFVYKPDGEFVEYFSHAPPPALADAYAVTAGSYQNDLGYVRGRTQPNGDERTMALRAKYGDPYTLGAVHNFDISDGNFYGIDRIYYDFVKGVESDQTGNYLWFLEDPDYFTSRWELYMVGYVGYLVYDGAYFGTGSQTDADDGWYNAKDITRDNQNRYFVLDELPAGQARVKVWTVSGNVTTPIGGFGNSTTISGPPISIEGSDYDGDIVVLHGDSPPHMVSLFTPEEMPG